MNRGNGFLGVICVAYLIGGFMLGGLALSLQIVVYQFAKKSWVKALPLNIGVMLWAAMLLTRFLGVNELVGVLASALYTFLGGWFYPYDLMAFAMSTLPILVGLAVGFMVSRKK